MNPKTNLLIIGQSLDALVTAVVMASLGQQITIASPNVISNTDNKPQKCIRELIQDYQFEYQLYALWQMYIQQEKIQIYQDKKINLSELIAATLINPQEDKAKYIWLFIDEIDTLTYEDKQALTKPLLKVILSGVLPIGDVKDLAHSIYNAQVFYIPFVFLQNNDSYTNMLKPKLLLIGEKTPHSSQYLTPLLPIIKQAERSAITDICTIEFVRSGIMTLLATRLSFINELATLAQQQEVDISEISKLMELDSRIGTGYLQAGWGFGGLSLPTELLALQQSFAQNKLDNHLIQAVDNVNQCQKEWLFCQFWQYFDGFITGKSVLIWGGSYKAGSGRTQNSAIHILLPLLWQHDVKTFVCAFEANTELAHIYINEKQLTICQDPYQPISKVDAILILNWSDFKIQSQVININRINEVSIPVFDGANILNKNQISELSGFYIGVGRHSL